MALTQAVALLGLVLEDDDLLALAVLDDGSIDGSAFHHGSAELGLVTQDSQNLVELDLVACLVVQLLDEQDIAFCDLVLLTTGLDDCMHACCTSFLNYGLAVGGGTGDYISQSTYHPFKAALKLYQD